tara:strand:- start:5675 stop:6868 length:1194 start_codon:yes stop_codon:yes gene_type:complete
MDKSKIYILGFNSFIAKQFYILCKKMNNNITLLEYNQVEYLKKITSNDVVINFCGVNRADSYDAYNNGNFLFIKKYIDIIKEKSPFLLHISSLMVCGFKDQKVEDLSNYKKWFIETKLKGEKYIKDNYKKNRYAIVRPANVFGYSCKPYYNNLLSTIVYEKLNNLKKINNINVNCFQYLISVQSLCKELHKIINNNKFGIFNIISNKMFNLKTVIETVYNSKIPEYITFAEGDYSVPDIKSKKGENIVILDDLKKSVMILEKEMIVYNELKNKTKITSLKKLSQPRGDMVEISSLESKRLYKITLNENAVRGNHFHFKQVEEFFNNKGSVTYLLAGRDNVNVVLVENLKENVRISILPEIIHTVVNDFPNNIPEIIITSTQEFVPNSAPDTEYVNIV